MVDTKEFKVEDWVYAEKGNHPSKYDYRKAWHIPIFQIAEISGSADLYVRAKVGDGNGAPIEILRKATSEEIEKHLGHYPICEDYEIY